LGWQFRRGREADFKTGTSRRVGPIQRHNLSVMGFDNGTSDGEAKATMLPEIL
jgi:hypothetical protein